MEQVYCGNKRIRKNMYIYILKQGWVWGNFDFQEEKESEECKSKLQPLFELFSILG